MAVELVRAQRMVTMACMLFGIQMPFEAAETRSLELEKLTSSGVPAIECVMVVSLHKQTVE